MNDGKALSDYVAGEIRAELARRASTGKELAAKLGVSRSWVSYRLTGTTEIGLNDLQRIAAALDLDFADLLPAPAHRNGGPQRPSVHLSPAPNGGPPHAPNVRSSAQPPSRTPDTKRRGQRPAWTHAGVTS